MNIINLLLWRGNTLFLYMVRPEILRRAGYTETRHLKNVELGVGTISLGTICRGDCEDRRDGISGD
jgi:hypothetical protein